MNATYKVVERKNPTAAEKPGKFYPIPVHNGRISLRELAIEIADRSTVNRMDVLAVLDGLLQLVPKKLADGQIVDLDFFGTFYLALKATGEEQSDQVSRRNIKEIKTRFRPSAEFKEQLQLIELRRLEEK